jgi:hypothetical protein
MLLGCYSVFFVVMLVANIQITPTQLRYKPESSALNYAQETIKCAIAPTLEGLNYNSRG